MPNKVTWKKGMRLSPEIFDSMDSSYFEALRMTALLCSANRYGLFTTRKPFELSVNISGNVLEVTSLSCSAVSKSGSIIDVDFDSNYNSTFDTRISIPSSDEGEAYYLVLKINEGKWREINEICSELSYSFELVGENSTISDNCIPIGMLVNQYGWRLNELDFVPPCLFVSAHPKFIEQYEKAKSIAKALFSMCLDSQTCIATTLLASIWEASTNVFSYLDKEYDTLTPAQLYHSIQRLITAFVVGSFADKYITIGDKEPFVMYMGKSYDARNIYRDIERGLALCSEIKVKMGNVCAMTNEPEPDPIPTTKVTEPITAPTKRRIRKQWDLEI